jgi:hypothetical protein
VGERRGMQGGTSGGRGEARERPAAAMNGGVRWRHVQERGGGGGASTERWRRIERRAE